MKLFLLLGLSFFIVNCNHLVTRESCENPAASLQKADFRDLAGNQDKDEYEHYKTTCQRDYKITIDQNAFSEAYKNARVDRLKAVCHCEDGFLTEAMRLRSGSYSLDQSEDMNKYCGEVGLAQDYQKGVDLAKADKKKRPALVATRDDAKNICAAP